MFLLECASDKPVLAIRLCISVGLVARALPALIPAYEQNSYMQVSDKISHKHALLRIFAFVFLPSFSEFRSETRGQMNNQLLGAQAGRSTVRSSASGVLAILAWVKSIGTDLIDGIALPLIWST